MESITDLLRTFPSLAAALPGIERAALADAPILILGEAGTGRSTLARALHRVSPRRDAPLVEVDPGLIASSLCESELFGHRAGAFTGAESTVAGRVAQAEGGTLLLDHIEELPLLAQPKLLRLLAERRYAPLGGREQEADVRFLAIASEDLRERVERGAFRQDLFYRLEVLAFRLPPLRERLADVGTLSEALLADLGRRFGRQPPRLGATARTWMARYRWPGNLRQLRNLLERAFIVADGAAEIEPPPPSDGGEPRPRSLQEIEREAILQALAYTRGRQGQAAALLGISRKALWEKRRRHGIP